MRSKLLILKKKYSKTQFTEVDIFQKYLSYIIYIVGILYSYTKYPGMQFTYICKLP